MGRAAASFLVLFLSAFSLSAQQSSEVGLFLGAANYMGDLAPRPMAYNETQFAFGGHYRYMPDPRFGVKGSITLGKISGKDANVSRPGQQERGWQMEAGVFEAALQGEWHFLGKPRYDHTGIFTPQLSPFISAGLGLTLSEAKVTVPPREKLRFPEPGDKSSFIVMPVSAGLRYDLSEFLLISGEVGLRATFSDYLDGLSSYLNSRHNDYYIFGGISILYVIEAEMVRSYRN
jgi:hypothetical protein